MPLSLLYREIAFPSTGTEHDGIVKEKERSRCRNCNGSITGGTFEGPGLKGTIVNGGADYQLNAEGRTELEAIYCIKTDDGIYIHVRNRGIIANGTFCIALNIVSIRPG